jgi:hypothetical protein
LFEKYGIENVKIIIIKNYPCNNKNELEAEEATYIRNNTCVNRNVPNRSQKERCEANKEKIKTYFKDYYEINKEKKQEYLKGYYEINKEKLNKQKKQYREANKKIIIILSIAGTLAFFFRSFFFFAFVVFFTFAFFYAPRGGNLAGLEHFNKKNQERAPKPRAIVPRLSAPASRRT